MSAKKVKNTFSLSGPLLWLLFADSTKNLNQMVFFSNKNLQPPKKNKSCGKNYWRIIKLRVQFLAALSPPIRWCVLALVQQPKFLQIIFIDHHLHCQNAYVDFSKHLVVRVLFSCVYFFFIFNSRLDHQMLHDFA